MKGALQIVGRSVWGAVCFVGGVWPLGLVAWGAYGLLGPYAAAGLVGLLLWFDGYVGGRR